MQGLKVLRKLYIGNDIKNEVEKVFKYTEVFKKYSKSSKYLYKNKLLENLKNNIDILNSVISPKLDHIWEWASDNCTKNDGEIYDGKVWLSMQYLRSLI